jgi:ATP-dependent exoDNAse (exonuclease V) beta subunit
MSFLKDQNTHDRDAGIVFDEEPHVYYVNGKTDNISVTTLVHKHFPKFDADLIISRMMRSKNWSKSQYFGKSASEIKAQWNQSGVDACTKGTYLHKSIELFYNNDPVMNNSTPEYKMFMDFLEDHKDKLEAYRTEWEVYDEDHKIAGSIDMVFKNTEDGTYSIYDWKRTKEIKMRNPYGGRGEGILHEFHDCNYVHYSLQLNIYKRILETKYGKTIRDMYLICMHPDYPKTYMKYEVMDMQSYVDLLFENRISTLR